MSSSLKRKEFLKTIKHPQKRMMGYYKNQELVI
jgi:hypothetical protein